MMLHDTVNLISSRYCAPETSDLTTGVVNTSLVSGAQYRLEIKFTVSGNIMEAWAYVNAEE